MDNSFPRIDRRLSNDQMVEKFNKLAAKRRELISTEKQLNQLYEQIAVKEEEIQHAELAMKGMQGATCKVIDGIALLEDEQESEFEATDFTILFAPGEEFRAFSCKVKEVSGNYELSLLTRNAKTGGLHEKLVKKYRTRKGAIKGAQTLLVRKAKKILVKTQPAATPKSSRLRRKDV